MTGDPRRIIPGQAGFANEAGAARVTDCPMPRMNTIDRLLRASIWIATLLASAALWWPAPAEAVRIKEVAAIQGVRSNQLVGYGLVVGLDGTGDQTTPHRSRRRA